MDNLAPGAVKNLAGARPSNVRLHWNPNHESDLQQYAVYRNGTKIAETSDTSYIDNPGGSSLDYHVTALDIHGNEGLPSNTKHFGPLAVSMSQLACNQVGEGIVITWRTESETDCAKWLIERSGDLGFGYLEIGRTNGQGNSSQPHDYSYSDNGKLETGNYYYRLTEVDLSGNKSYYGPISITYKSKTPSDFVLNAAYPNPTHGAVTFKYQLPKSSNVKLDIYNVAGQKVKAFELGTVNAGYHTLNWGGLVSQGVYVYRMNLGEKSFNGKVMVIK